MKEKPEISDFIVTEQVERTIHIFPGDTLSIEYQDERGMRETVLQEKITEKMETDTLFIAKADIDGKKAKMGGFTIK